MGYVGAQLARAREGVVSANRLGGAFRQAKYEKTRLGEKEGGQGEGGQKFPPLKPLPFCPPEFAGL